MGFMSNIFTQLGLKKRKASLLVVGLDNSGKTTVVDNLNAQRQDEIAPTLGFQLDRYALEGVKLTVMDMSGQRKYHKLWEGYYADADAVAFVVDSADKRRVEEARTCIEGVLSHADLQGKPLLVLANKKDLVMAMTAPEVAGELGLDRRDWAGRSYQIQACSAKTGEGVRDGLAWLVGQLKKGKPGGKS
eukprot:CAMPEP_0182882912 /NCGR_PEP_ID=MMETSP0034_2-20130328/18074_1 /TAXON_ID=156128 /ORGANISM="Nephroselmis pyriformis, Strain CCMP717" /LENGTH=188 /DNA_ID=CAMNT_0025016031 /DNA_START=100 /DNA_END=662 /DNA_ORIENTATION=+